MSVDVLILNSAGVDWRGSEFTFVSEMAVDGGLVICGVGDRPDYSEQQMQGWIDQGRGTAGGPGNCAPLMARAGIKTAVGVNLGKGDYDGLDAAGRFFRDTLANSGVDMSAVYVHPYLPTCVAFINSAPGDERGGIVSFPGANHDFDFGHFKAVAKRLDPKIVYYMYSGTSIRGDANNGRDLAEFVNWCRRRGSVTVVDSHTFAGDPAAVVASGEPVEPYRLLEPLLGELDVFFTSTDEGKMIENTLSPGRNWSDCSEHENHIHLLKFLTERYWSGDDSTRIVGVTVSNGAYYIQRWPSGYVGEPAKVTSRFMIEGVVDLVGAGDAFRAGFFAYLARNFNTFRAGQMDIAEAVQMGNLMASLLITGSLHDRYANIRPYESLLKVVRDGVNYTKLAPLRAALVA
jgi:sugar/nucleoside kinase (ribokinase family)